MADSPALWVIEYEGPTLTEDDWTHFRNPPKARPGTPSEILSAARSLLDYEAAAKAEHDYQSGGLTGPWEKCRNQDSHRASVTPIVDAALGLAEEAQL